jgi:hypothetical protein
MLGGHESPGCDVMLDSTEHGGFVELLVERWMESLTISFNCVL